jgi:hypothetical protein
MLRTWERRFDPHSSPQYTRLAQLVEQQTDNLLVAGSNPAPGTIFMEG